MSTQNNSQHSSFPYFSLSVNNFHPYNPQTAHKQSFEPSQRTPSIYEVNVNLQYYEEFKKLYFTSYCISLQFKKIIKVSEEHQWHLLKLEKKMEQELKNESSQLNVQKQKRIRRKADQIQRRFVCQAERCGKNYGSEGSLVQHIKLKHPEMAKKCQPFGYQSL